MGGNRRVLVGGGGIGGLGGEVRGWWGLSFLASVLSLL